MAKKSSQIWLLKITVLSGHLLSVIISAVIIHGAIFQGNTSWLGFEWGNSHFLGFIELGVGVLVLLLSFSGLRYIWNKLV
jgi:hypothetical protein